MNPREIFEKETGTPVPESPKSNVRYWIRYAQWLEKQLDQTAEAVAFESVKATTDGSSHWFVIPNELYKQFCIDLDDEEMVDSGEFDDKYRMYSTGGDLNNVQLYKKFKEEGK